MNFLELTVVEHEPWENPSEESSMLPPVRDDPEGEPRRLL
jgi:hypothetical protein